MKPKHVSAYRVDALSTFTLLRINPSQDFHTLTTAQVERVLEEADRVKYRKPANANGSRARYFYQLLQRRARA